MGFLYNEIVEYKHHSRLRMILLLALILTTASIALLFRSFDESIFGAIFSSIFALMLGAGFMMYAWARCTKRYKYSIIADELIIERIKGDRKRVELDINVKYITDIENAPEGYDGEGIFKTSRFACSGKRDNIYYCTYKKGGKIYGFYFEPSENLVEKIRIMMKRAV
jgi:hypothetical protein